MKLFGVDKDGKLTPYNEYDFKIRNREEILESLLENNPEYIFGDETVLIIGRQVQTNLGSLNVDLNGNHMNNIAYCYAPYHCAFYIFNLKRKGTLYE